MGSLQLLMLRRYERESERERESKRDPSDCSIDRSILHAGSSRLALLYTHKSLHYPYPDAGGHHPEWHKTAARRIKEGKLAGMYRNGFCDSCNSARNICM